MPLYLGTTQPSIAPDVDDSIFTDLFDPALTQGCVPMLWEVASQCPCITDDTREPVWACPTCGGSGVVYATPVPIVGLFRSRSQRQSYRRQGEFAHGDADLTTALSVKVNFIDRRVKDRLTVTAAVDDAAEGTHFYPETPPVPFVFGGLQRAWRVPVTLARDTQDLVP